MALNGPLTDAAKILTTSLNEGSGTARANLGGGGTAFGAVRGLVPTVANYVSTAEADGTSVNITTVSESGTPALKVAEGVVKPTAATVTPGTVTLEKFAGLGSASLEQTLSATGLGNAIASVLGRSSLKAFETDCVAILDAGAGDTVTGADWVAATAAAQASLLGSGLVPSVLVVSSDDYSAFVGDVLGTSAFATDPNSPVGALLGTPIHVSAGAPTGKAFLVDAAAVVAISHKDSPAVVLDAVSQAETNTMRIVVDLVAKLAIVDALGVVEITAPVAAAAQGQGHRK